MQHMQQYEITEEQIPAWQEAIAPFAEKQLNELAASHPDLDKAKQMRSLLL